MILLRLRWCLFALAALALVAGASGELSPGLSTLLWLPALLVFACAPSSPVRRAVAWGLRVPADPPQTLVTGGTSRTPE